MKPYLYFNGLKKIVKEIAGNEVIHIGIRPYGFHAGNVMALIVYPYLLCKYFEMEGKVPKFRFIVSINDWEQDYLDGPDPRKYPFNIYPKNSSLQFTPDENGCCKSIVDHWKPIIEKNLNGLKNRFSGISIKFIKNSRLIEYFFCRELLLETIRNPQDQLDIFKKYSDKEVLDSPLQYAGVICYKCKKAHGETTILGKNTIKWKCRECGATKEASVDKFNYWWYHKPMFLARLKIFKIDIALSGGDHFTEGDFKIREAFIKKYSPKTKEPKMLFTPTVIALDGQKMSKSRGNASFIDVQKLIKSSDKYRKKEFYITKDLISKNIDEKDYSRVF